jgi:hypothetical protein
MLQNPDPRNPLFMRVFGVQKKTRKNPNLCAMCKLLRKILGLDGLEDLKKQVVEIGTVKGHTLLTDRELLSATLTATSKQLVEVKQERDQLRARLTCIEGELRKSEGDMGRLLEALEDEPLKINGLELQGARSALAIALRQNEALDKTVVEAISKLAQRDAGIENAIRILKTLDFFVLNTEDDLRDWLSGRQKELHERIEL